MPSEPGEERRDSSPAVSPVPGATLEEVLEAYLEQLADGEEPDQEAYLAAYPDLADSLRGVFRTLDFVETTSRSLSVSTIAPGAVLGEYRIIREVARGGMGVVYEAVQKSMGRRVALKVLPTGALLTESAKERFAREAATAGRLHHTNIVPVYAVGEEHGIHYYVMQFIEGHSLAEHLRQKRERGEAPDAAWVQRVANWGMQAAEALAHAHKHGVVHRDVKPSNLLLDAKDNVWMTDFGLARAESHETITVTGDLIGTAKYMSPEQVRGGGSTLDGRTDVYSLGATLYELLSLRPPFEGESRDEVLNRIVMSSPRALRDSTPLVPRDLETIVNKCMERDVHRRYQNASELAEDLRRFNNNEPIRARRTPWAVKAMRFVRQHRWHAAGVVLALVLALTSIGLVVKMRRQEGQRLLEQAFERIMFDQDFAEADALLDRAEAHGVKSAELHLYRGLVPLMDNEPRRAFKELTIASEMDPGSLDIRHALALAYNAASDFANGRKMLDTAAEQEINSALSWQLRGLALSKLQRTDAIECYNKAIELRPDFTPAIDARARYRGIRLLTEGRREELEPMLSDFDAFVVFRPKFARSYAARSIGWLYAAAHAVSQEDLQASRERWLMNCLRDSDKAMELRRLDDSLPLVERGLYQRFIGAYSDAAETFKQAIDVDRGSQREPHPYRIHERTICLYAHGDLDMAIAETRPAAEDAQAYLPLQLQYALLLAEVGRMDEARAVCDDAMLRQKGTLNAVILASLFLELLGGEPAVHEADFPAPGKASESPLVDFLAGRVDSTFLLEAAGDDPGLRCEYAFVIAMRALAHGDRAAGEAALRACVDSGVFIYIEYRFAQAMLARLESDPHWPGWLDATD